MSNTPDDEFGPKIASLLHDFALSIAKEADAKGVRVTCEFFLDKTINPPRGKGRLKLNTFTTPDAKHERMLDPKVLMPKGSKLAHDALITMRSTFKKITGG